MPQPTILVLLGLLSLGPTATVLAQSLEWVRSSSGEEGTFSSVWDLALDPSGNVYATGWHQGSIDLSGDGTLLRGLT